MPRDLDAELAGLEEQVNPTPQPMDLDAPGVTPWPELPSAGDDTLETDPNIPLAEMIGAVPDAAKEKLKTGAWNIMFGIPDTVLSLASKFAVEPIVMAGNAARAAILPDTVSDSVFDNNKDFAERFISLQSKAAAGSGYYNFLRYEPITEFGAGAVDKLTYPFELLGRGTKAVGEFMGDQTDARIDVISQAIRDKTTKENGGLTALEDLKITEDTVAAKATVNSMMRTMPDALMLAVPFLSRSDARARGVAQAREAGAKTAAVTEALNTRVVPLSNLENLQGYNKDSVSTAEITRLRDEISKGELSPDISIETVGGNPTRILTGQDGIRSIQMLMQESGLKVKGVKVRYVEKDVLSPQEVAALNVYAASGFREILKNEKVLGEIELLRDKGFRDSIVAALIDQSGNVKRELVKQLGEVGLVAVQKLELIAGGTPRAQLMFTDTQKQVWGSRGRDNPAISPVRKISVPDYPSRKLSEHDLFDIFAHARRVQEIARYKPGVVKEVNVKGPDGKPLIDPTTGKPVKSAELKAYSLEGPINPDNAAGLVYKIKETLGAKRFQQFEERLADLHTVMRTVLTRMYEAGLITEVQFKKMQNLNYLRREFIKESDPSAPSYIRGAKVTVPDSGIAYIEHGTRNRAFNTDVEMVVAEHIARTERRIAKNEAAKALALGAETGLADFVKPAGKGKPPEGWSEIHYMDKGVRKGLWMRDNMAAEWIYGDPALTYRNAQILRMMSGSSIIKPLATGYNPEFAVRNFLRDIQHVWRATGTEYSSFLPVYLGQIGTDLITVGKDVAIKGPRYRQYIMDGGGSETLAHQGRSKVTNWDTEASLARQFAFRKGPVRDRWEKIKDGASFMNAFSEDVVRIAVRERVLKNQLTKEEPLNTETAAWIARRYLDFSQGGTLTKTLDTTIPYLNATTQALRTGIRPYFQGPKSAATIAFKDAQLLGVKAAMQSRFWASDPEVMRQVDDETLISNFVIPTNMWIRDDDGTFRSLLWKFPMDGSTVPFSGPMDLLIKKGFTGESPSKDLLDLLNAANPVGLGFMPPTVQAIYGASVNWNTYQDDKIWKGDDVPPGFEYTERTPEAYKLMGEMFPNTVSPVRLQYMTRTMAPSNTYIYASEFMANSVLGAEDETTEYLKQKGEMGDVTSRFLAGAPFVRRVIHLGHPNEAMNQIEKQALQEANAQIKVLNDSINKATRDFSTYPKGDPRRTKMREEMFNIIREKYADRPDIMELTVKTFENKIVVDQIWNSQVGKDIYFPGKDKWVQWAVRPPEERAKLFYMVWRVKPNQAERDKMFRIAAAIDSAGATGTIINDRFLIQFNKEKEAWGTEFPITLGGDEK